MKKLTLLISMILILGFDSFSQSRKYSVKRPMDVTYQVSVGTSHILGDLGGGIGEGVNHMGDLDLLATRGAGEFSVVFRSMRHTRVIPSIGFISLYSSDALTNNYDRNLRNFDSRTWLIEPSVSVEQQISKLDQRYVAQGGYFFLSGGLAFPIFKSTVGYADPGAGSRLSLPEPQGAKVSVSIPVGVSYRYYYSSRYSIGISIVGRKTFSDRFDGTEATYSNSSETIGEGIGLNGATLATNRASDSHKDHYLTMMVSMRFALNHIPQNRF